MTCLTPLRGLHGHFGSASIAPCGLAQLIKFPTLSEFYQEVAPWPIVKVPRAAQAADRVEVRGILAGSGRAEAAANKVEVDQEVAKAVQVEVGRAAVAGKADQAAVKRVAEVVREVQGEARAGRAEGVGKAGRGARTASTVRGGCGG